MGGRWENDLYQENVQYLKSCNMEFFSTYQAITFIFFYTGK